jgi:hypothetical protein
VGARGWDSPGRPDYLLRRQVDLHLLAIEPDAHLLVRRGAVKVRLEALTLGPVIVDISWLEGCDVRSWVRAPSPTYVSAGHSRYSLLLVDHAGS